MNSCTLFGKDNRSGNKQKKHGFLIAAFNRVAILLCMLLLLSTSNLIAQIAQRGSATTATSTNATLTINKPTGVVQGDIMIANIGNYCNGCTQTTASLLGWTAIAGTDLSRGRATLLYKIAGASEPNSYSFSVTSTTTLAVGGIVAFSGVNSSNPFDVTPPSSWYNAGSASLSQIPSITTVTANAAVLIFANLTRAEGSTSSANFSTYSLTSPSSLTELFDVGHNGTNPAPAVGAAWALKTTTGATGNGGFASSQNPNSRTMGGMLIALRPCVAVNAGSSLSAICSGGTSAALGGSVGGSATGGIWSDGGVGGSFNPNATTLNATYTPASSYTGIITLTLTTTGATCTNISASKSLTVNPSPINVTAAASSTSICTGNSINLTSSATLASTYSWSSSPAGYTSASQNPSGILPSVNTTYTVTASNSFGCSTTASTSLVTVNSAPTVASVNGAANCGSGSVTLSATTQAGATIDWYNAATAGTLLLSDNASFTTPVITNTTTYYAAARNTTTGCTSATRTAVTASINNAPAIADQTASSIYGTASGYNIVATNTLSYAASGLPTGMTLNGTTGALSIAASTAAGVYAISLSALAAGCPTASATLTYTVDQKSLTVTANNITKCFGNTYTLGTTAFTSSGLASGDVITAVNLVSDGADIFADLGTYNITPSGASGASFNASNYNINYVNGTMTVVDVPSYTTQPSAAGQTICQNSSATALTVAATAGSGTISGYQWYSNTTAGSFGGTAISGATAASYTPSTTTPGTLYYYCIVTNSNGCTMPSAVSGAYVVNALPAAVTVTGGGTFCNNTILSASNGASGTIYFQGTTSNGTSIADASSTKLIDVAGIYYFRAQSTQGCWGAQGTATVVLQAPIVTGVEICAGGTGSLSTGFNCTPLNNQTSGPREAGTGANITGVGTLAWTNPNNIAGAGTAGMSVTSSTTTNYLRGTNYGFSIPSNAVINGITVVINRSTSGTTSPLLRDNRVSLVKSGVIESTNKAATGTNWSGSLSNATYGGTTDLWGSAWTPSEINSTDFGVVLSAINSNTGSTRTAAVDYMRITVTYSIPGDLSWYTQSSGGSSIATGSSFNPAGVAGSGLSNTNTPGTVTYYVECATNAGCRGSADFIINALPAAPAVTGAERCGTGSVTLSATPGSGEAIDWYNQAVGGTALASASNSFTTPSISASTIYYAEARNIAKSCLSPTRSAVAAFIKANTSSSETVSVCDSYSWNGNTYTSSGTYTYNTTNAAGCDSVASLVLTITPSTSNTSSASACDSYTWSVNGQTYTSSGSYTSVAGCNTEILNLTITASTYNATPVSACDSYTWAVNNQTYSTSGAYTLTTGCHNEILNLTITASTSNTSNVSACGSYFWSVNGQSYSSSGIYMSTVGCFTEILNLTITSSVSGDTTAAACGSYNWYGNTYTASGDYTKTLTAVNGCDSIVTLHLTVNPIPVLGSISGTTEVCSLIGSTTPTLYSVSPYASAASYNWTVPPGVIIAGGQGTSSLSVTFNNTLAATNQRIQLTVTDGVGCQSAASVFQLSKTIPNLPVAIIGQVNLCPVIGLDTTLTYSVAPVANAESYLWAAPTGGQIISGQGTTSVQVKYLSTFVSGVMSCTSVAACGNRAPRTLILSRSAPASPAAINGPTAACTYIGTGVQATYSIAAVANATGYLWTVPNNVTIVSGQGTTSIVVTFSGAYNTTSFFKVRALSNCFNTADRQLAVSAATFSAPGSITGPTNACPYINNQDALATYTIRKVPNVSSYIWTVPAGATIVSHPAGLGANDTVINVSFSSNFVYGSQILVQSAGCGASAARSISINGTLPSAPGIITGPNNACEFMVSTTNPNGNIATYSIRKVVGASQYIWTAPDHADIIGHPAGTGENDTTILVKYEDDFTSGLVSVRSYNACGSSSQRTLVVGRLNPAAPGVFDVVMTNPCPSRMYTYTLPSMPANATSIQWTVPTGCTIISGQSTTSITVSYPPSQVGGLITAQSFNNCSSSSIRTFAVKFTACPSSFAGGNNPSGKTTAVLTEEVEAVIAPNPTTSSFKLNLSGFSTTGEMVKVKVMDVQGRMVSMHTMMPTDRIQFGNDLKAGSYLIQITQGNKTITKRAMKF